jgi:hypothetical protein
VQVSCDVQMEFVRKLVDRAGALIYACVSESWISLFDFGEKDEQACEQAPRGSFLLLPLVLPHTSLAKACSFGIPFTNQVPSSLR